jgi:hypothetical protein
MWLLSLIKDPVKATFGVDLPVENVGGSTATTAVSMSVGQTGLQQLSVGLGGSYTAASITRTLGITWPVEDDMFVMRAPSVVYTVLPTSLAVTMEVDVPLLDVQAMASSLVVQPAGVVQLQVGPDMHSLATGQLNWFGWGWIAGGEQGHKHEGWHLFHLYFGWRQD